MQNIYYWTGFVDPQNQILPEHHKVIIQLLHGNSVAAKLDLKQHNGQNKIYGVRINRDDRILFTTIQVNQQPSILILDVILNHDYDKSWVFKNKSAVNKFIERCCNTSTQKMFALEEIEITEQNLQCAADTQVVGQIERPRFISLQNNILLLWDEAQTEAIQASLPFFITGAAGSGKTAIALRQLQQLASHAEVKLYYITKSPGLVAQFKRNWVESIDLNEDTNLKQPIHFLSYEGLIRSIDAQYLNNLQTADEKHFIEWVNTNKSIPQIKHLKAVSLSAIYNEFKLLALILLENSTNANIYSQLGQRQSLIAEELRAAMLELYRLYIQHLTHEHYVDFHLYQVQNKAPVGMFIVDEVQDLSPLQIKILIELALELGIGFFGDTNQAITNPYTCLYLFERVRNLQMIQLHTQFRAPLMIAQLAQEVLKLKNKLLGGTLNKTDYITYNCEANTDLNLGMLTWVDDEQSLKEIQQKVKQSPTVAIIVADESFIEEAGRFFETVLVFTPHTIKGLEYDVVILYHFFSAQHFLVLNKACSEQMLAAECSKNQPKDKGVLSKISELLLRFNEIFVALTRSRKKLIIIDIQKTLEFSAVKVSEHKFSLRRYLQQQCKQVATQSQLVESIGEKLSADEVQQKWTQEANRLIATEDVANIKIAQDICENYLQKSNDPAIYEAAERGTVDRVLKMLTHKDPKTKKKINKINRPRPSDGNTLLQIAVQHYRIELVQKLLNIKGINIHKKNFNDETALYTAFNKNYFAIAFCTLPR